MYFDDFKQGDTLEIPPAVIDKNDMMDFAEKTIISRCTPTRHMHKQRLLKG